MKPGRIGQYIYAVMGVSGEIGAWRNGSIKNGHLVQWEIGAVDT